MAHKDTRLLDLLLALRRKGERFLILVETILSLAEHELADLEAWLAGRRAGGEKTTACPQCGQLPGRQSGEYPCAACGEPTLHDPEGPEGEPAAGTGRNE